MTTMDEDLRTADPARHLDEAQARAAVAESWRRVRTASRGSLRRRRTLLLPLALTVVALSTGAALTAPIWLGVGEDAVPVAPDVQIPITYTTLSGVPVDCVWAVRVGEDQRSAEDERVAQALAHTDWHGIGQEIYDHAIANPRGPQPGEVWKIDTPEVRDALTFRLSVTPMIERRLPAEIQALQPAWASTSTCTGPFR